MTKMLLLSAAAAAAICTASPSSAQNRDRFSRELGYFLPQTRVGATIHQVIRQCPAALQPLRVDTIIAISDRAGPDPSAFMRIDLRGGALTARTTKLSLRPDGTLSAFNATSTGEAGQVISAAIGLGTTIATLGAGGVPSPLATAVAPRLTCTSETAARVQRLQAVESDLALLRSRIAQGHESPAAAQALAGLTAELSELVGKLTLRTNLPPFVPTTGDFQGGSGSGNQIVKFVAPIVYDDWFVERGAVQQAGLAAALLPGRHGFRATVTADPQMLGILARGDGSAPPPTQPASRFYYRRPVAVAVAIVPCLSRRQDTDCPPDQNAGVSAQKSVLLPQLSGHFSLPIGRRNLFGTRATAATFDEQGAPVTLEVGSTSGGADIAGVINSVNASAITLRDAETAANTRRIAEIKAERELQALLAEPTP